VVALLFCNEKFDLVCAIDKGYLSKSWFPLAWEQQRIIKTGLKQLYIYFYHCKCKFIFINLFLITIYFLFQSKSCSTVILFIFTFTFLLLYINLSHAVSLAHLICDSLSFLSYIYPYDWRFPYIFILVFQYCTMDMRTTGSLEVWMWKGISEKQNIKL